LSANNYLEYYVLSQYMLRPLRVANLNIRIIGKFLIDNEIIPKVLANFAR
jgi:hypothetical protein